MRRVIWLCQFFLVVVFTAPVALLPYRVSLKVGEVLGSSIIFFWRSLRAIAVENLRAAVRRRSISIDASPEEVIKRNFRNLGKSVVEVLKIYYGLGEQVMQSVRISGSEHLQAAREKGKGVIFITGHCGNWELNALVFSRRLGRVNIVARPVDNPYINRLVERAREKYGNRVIYKKGALKRVLSCLGKKEIVGILMDQSVVAAEGVVTEFLGKKDYTARMPALIARKTGSPVVPAFIRRTPEGHLIEIHEAVQLNPSLEGETAVANDTARFSSYIEEYIRQNPSEWLWIHRRWKRIKS
ncbi:MAG: lysophospholipid acyltransferase family protein [Candidatus Sulfobium sp.]